MLSSRCKLSFEILSLSTSVSVSQVVATAPTAYFLHGILGSKRNWRTPARACLKVLPQGYVGVAVDHRAHGDSVVTKDMAPHTVENCALDFDNFVKDSHMHSPSILVAHSFGGKVALKYLSNCIKDKKPIPQHTWILDSFPGKYDKMYDKKRHQSVFQIIDLLNHAPKTYSSRNEAAQYLTNHGIALGIAQWLGTSLVQNTPGHWAYSFDINAIVDLFDDFCNIDMWEFLESFNGNGKIHFVRAGKNRAWTTAIEQQFLLLSNNNPRITYQVMPNVDHWLHAENPDGVAALIASKL